MDALSVAISLAVIALFFSAGFLAVFISGVTLARKKGKFACAQCGNCCRLRFIQLSPGDIKRMEDGGLRDFYEPVGKEFRLKRKNGRCIFLKPDGTCSIYMLRPEVCRRFPFFTLLGIPYCRPASFCPGVEGLKNA